jgi:hypothetical protein
MDAAAFARPLAVSCRLRPGRPPRLELADGPVAVAVEGDAPVATARSRALDREAVDASLLAFGGSGHRIATADVDLAPDAFVPLAALKALRRRALAALEQARRTAAPRPPAATLPAGGRRRRATGLWVRTDDPAQIGPLLAGGAERILLHGAAAPVPSSRVWTAREADRPATLADLPPGPLLAGHPGWLAVAGDRPVILDATANLQNLAAIAAWSRPPVAGIILGRELDADRLGALLDHAADVPVMLGVIVQDRPPLMRARWPWHPLPPAGALGPAGDGPPAYRLLRDPDGCALLEAGAPRCDEAAADRSRGRTDAWVIDCRRQDAATSLAQLAFWRQRLSGG